MAFKRQGATGEVAASSPPTGKRFGGTPATAPSEGMGTAAKIGLAGAGTAALTALLAKYGLGNTLKTANAVRQQLMLTGFAGVKSLLGNVGAGVEAAVEGKGLGALKEILSGETVADAARNFTTGQGAAQIGAGHAVDLPKWLSFPGRAMGAIDEATQAALRRSGMSAGEATSAVLQKPLDGRLGAVVESPMAQYLHPFRRTPFNQWLEGLDKYKAAVNGDRAAIRGLAAYSAAGAAHGAATSDDQLPMSVPFAISASGRYGLPYGVAALVGRSLAGGTNATSGIAGSVLPVSEYGVESATDIGKLPYTTFKPAALTALERMTKY